MPIHGKSGTYTNHKCRCDLCCAAIREYGKARRRGDDTSRPDPHHGTRPRYERGCKCGLCLWQHRTSTRKYKDSSNYREYMRKYMREYRRSNPELARQINNRKRHSWPTKSAAQLQATNKRDRDLQKATAANASRSGEPWTGAEDTVVTDSELTALEKSFLLRRSLYAVRYRQKVLRGLNDR